MEDYYFTLEAIDDKKILARLWNYAQAERNQAVTEQRRVQIAQQEFDSKGLTMDALHEWARSQVLASEDGISSTEFLLEYGTEHKIAASTDPVSDYPAWVQPTGAHDAYAKGSQVQHNDKVWESTTEANVWEPGVSGWKEIVIKP